MWKLLGITAIASLVTAGLVQIGHAAQPASYRDDIQKRARENSDFRRVLFTGQHIQVVAMAIPAKQDIGEEVHEVDQCLFLVQGSAQAVLDGKPSDIGKGGAVCVPAGTRHNIRNTGSETLKLFTTYAPPEHPDGTVHHTKADAERAERAETAKPN